MGYRAQLPATSCVFRYDPYQTETAVIVEKETFTLPTGTLHQELEGQAAFMPYPTEEFYCAGPELPKDQMARLFIGQLPYGVTNMQLQWLCATFGNGVAVHFPERIVKNDALKTGAKIPTGCVHAYCHPEDVEALMAGMHKKLLIDDTGVWFTQNLTELAALHGYTAVMKKDRTQRPMNRPYDTVVIQLATSTYVPRPPCYKHAAKLPAYGAAVVDQ